jgi:hypothetical protein
MKNMILSLFILAAGAFAWTGDRVYLKENVGKSQPIHNKTNADVVIDTAEADTSDIYFDLVDLPRMSVLGDTVGVAWMRCDDSAGTDSVAGRLIWHGNPKPDGSALWEKIDSVSIAAASGTETQSEKAVVNTNGYQAIRFVLYNQLAPAAGKKTVCRDIILNRIRRLVD